MPNRKWSDTKTDIPEDETLYSAGDICNILKLSEATVNKMFKSGEIPAYKIRNQFRVKQSDFYNWLEKQRTPTVRKSK
jgi:excisionase family DNA binding protein